MRATVFLPSHFLRQDQARTVGIITQLMKSASHLVRFWIALNSAITRCRPPSNDPRAVPHDQQFVRVKIDRDVEHDVREAKGRNNGDLSIDDVTRLKDALDLEGVLSSACHRILKRDQCSEDYTPDFRDIERVIA
ncbi:MAG: hypothetical protein ABJF67_16800 [Aurantimonas coralicida]|uniref:hypothetical protein n=1 Tax=Nisaea sp. TaxID=2024842 RepID=UPI0032668D43